MYSNQRCTQDIGLMMSHGQKRQAQKQIGTTHEFGVGLKFGRSWYKASDSRSHNVDVLEPGKVRQTFNAESNIVSVKGVELIKSPVILNATCNMRFLVKFVVGTHTNHYSREPCRRH